MSEETNLGWKVYLGETVVECPGCSFRMGIAHVSEGEDRPFYDCPNCGDSAAAGSGPRAPKAVSAASFVDALRTEANALDAIGEKDGALWYDRAARFIELLPKPPCACDASGICWACLAEGKDGRARKEDTPEPPEWRKTVTAALEKVDDRVAKAERAGGVPDYVREFANGVGFYLEEWKEGRSGNSVLLSLIRLFERFPSAEERANLRVRCSNPSPGNLFLCDLSPNHETAHEARTKEGAVVLRWAR